MAQSTILAACRSRWRAGVRNSALPQTSYPIITTSLAIMTGCNSIVAM